MGKRIERKIVAKVIGSVPGQTAGDSGAWKVVVYFSHQIVAVSYTHLRAHETN